LNKKKKQAPRDSGKALLFQCESIEKGIVSAKSRNCNALPGIQTGTDSPPLLPLSYR
jgi:hypothetical protein